MVTLTKIVGYKIEKGPKFALEIVNLETDITSDMVLNHTWKDAQFKPYNFNSEGVYPNSGALHPLNKVREEFRQIFFSMGFTEMPSNQYVETGFWNFDTLFVPQQHPARDLQDTFYLKDPKKLANQKINNIGKTLNKYTKKVNMVLLVTDTLGKQKNH